MIFAFGKVLLLRECTAVQAELWTVREGLGLAWDGGYGRVVLEVDSSTVVKWLRDVEIGSVQCKVLEK